MCKYNSKHPWDQWYLQSHQEGYVGYVKKNPRINSVTLCQPPLLPSSLEIPFASFLLFKEAQHLPISEPYICCALCLGFFFHTFKSSYPVNLDFNLTSAELFLFTLVTPTRGSQPTRYSLSQFWYFLHIFNHRRLIPYILLLICSYAYVLPLLVLEAKFY